MEIRGPRRREAVGGRGARPARPVLEGLGRRPRRAPAGDREAVLAPAVHHRRRRLEAGGPVHPAADRARGGRPGQACATTRGSSARRWRRPRPSGRRWSVTTVTPARWRWRSRGWSSAGNLPMPPTAAPSRSSSRTPARSSRRSRRARRGDVDRAVDAASAAFDGGGLRWPPRTAGGTCSASPRRSATTRRSWRALESRQVGKPIGGARWEIGQVSKVLEFYAGAATKIRGSTIPVTRPGLDLTLQASPSASSGLIVPWNFPLMMASWKVGPALAAGNTAVLKPASWSPLDRPAPRRARARGRAAARRAERGHRARARGRHARWPPTRRIGKIAFTGETATGREIMRAAAGTVKKVSLELGGKSPNIVFADADLEAFARGIAVRRVRQLRPGLLRAQPDPRRAVGPRARRRAVRRRHGAGEGRRPVRRRRPRSVRSSRSASASASRATSRAAWPKGRRW